VLRALNRRNVLVVDWGGGTLDITLCRLGGGRVVQLRNGGSADVGGDRFDEAIRDEIIKRFSERSHLGSDAEIHPEARLRLLHDSEANKIALSERPAVSFYLPDFFRRPQTTLEYRLTRDELDEITRPIITSGMHEMETLLESVNIAPSQIALCLVVGGMAAMPAIRGRLHEVFGPQRVEIPADGGTLVAQGAAWIAHDSQRLRLAKPIELQMARGSYLTLARAGTEMPTEHEVKQNTVHLYCSDPTDGVAKFQLCCPTRASESPQASEPRTSLGTLTVSVDQRAAPFRERLELEYRIDYDLILTTRVWSSEMKDKDVASFYDLEFGLLLGEVDEPDGHDPHGDLTDVGREHGSLTVRANVTGTVDDDLVPGEVLYKHKRSSFQRLQGVRTRATEEQIHEHLYYEPCDVCGRPSSDPECQCLTNPQPRRSGVEP
jgi:molecular chaperone DnaK (HSP70)